MLCALSQDMSLLTLRQRELYHSEPTGEQAPAAAQRLCCPQTQQLAVGVHDDGYLIAELYRSVLPRLFGPDRRRIH